MQSERVLPVADGASKITLSPSIVSLAVYCSCSPFVAFVSALTFNDWHNSTLLNLRRALEAVFVDTAEELAFEVRLVEGSDSLIVIELHLTCRQQ